MAEEFENADLSGGTGPSSDDRLWVLLAYVLAPLIPVIILFMEDKKSRPFIKAHNAQALAWGVLSILVGMPLSSVTCGLASLVMWGIAIYWGYQGYQGQMVQIPVITDFVQNQGWA
ncbi:MAG: hypothetical protein R6X32_13365 [Chloroflexota bacterium]